MAATTRPRLGRRARSAGSIAVLAVVVSLTAWTLPGGAVVTPNTPGPQTWPALHTGQSYGVDVASFQGQIDWTQVAHAGVSFAYIKATQGTGYVNPYFASDWTGAAQAGLLHGAYQFFSLCSSGLAQAREFLDVAPPSHTALPAAVDLELRGNCSGRPSRAAVGAQLSAFVRAVQQATGRPVLYYVGKDFGSRYHLSSLRRGPLWLNQVLRPPSSGAVVWQMKRPVPMAGVAVPVDLDIARLHQLETLST